MVSCLIADYKITQLLSYIFRYRGPKQKWGLFLDQYLHKSKTKSARYTFNLIGGIHSSVWSAITFLCPIRNPRYKQNNMGYHISRI